jgi:hypothetical protein
MLRHTGVAGRPGCPPASLEFEVEDPEAVAAAGGELQRAGFELLHLARKEPWGQTVTRVLTEDGLIVGISHAPVFSRRGGLINSAPPAQLQTSA